MATCKEVSRLISEDLDRPLPLRQRVRMRLHLAICRLCRRYRRQLEFLQRATRQLSTPDEEATRHALPPEARRRIRQRLDGGG